MNIHYVSLKQGTPARSYWDMALLDDLLEGIPESDRQIVVIPGAYQGDIIDKINLYLKQFSKVLVFVTSDEEGKFDIAKLSHPDMICYRQYGYSDHLFPIGYTTETRPQLKAIGRQEKDIDIFFAGQLNSSERRNVFASLVGEKRAVLFGTDGFSRGLSRRQYYEYLAAAKTAPAPGGHVSPDSFRFYEALEAGCKPTHYPPYMRTLFPDMPYDVASNNQWFAWWIGKKVQLRNQIKKDVGVLDAMTTVVPTSPIASHPNTSIIDQTIASIRHHTAMPIIITIDGVREEQMHLKPAYDEYVERLLWKCNFEYADVIPLVFETHMHQARMMREALKLVQTPLVMYVEHDTPLVTDEPIDWAEVSDLIMTDTAHVVRFHYESFVPEVHEKLMLHERDLPHFIATRQWSQRPHVARTEFYRGIMSLFTEEANCFIEDFLHGKCAEGNWDDWRVFIYAPGENIKRSLNLDGREGGTKYDDRQVW